MTIDRDNLLAVAVCDGCGDRIALDVMLTGDDPEREDSAIAADLIEAGWVQRKPERHRFAAGGMVRAAATIIYPQDFCADCQDPAPKPAPLIATIRPRPAKVADAFANDPCDEWSRAHVWDALGLRSDCGHPRSATWGTCGYCDAGYPIGHQTKMAMR